MIEIKRKTIETKNTFEATSTSIKTSSKNEIINEARVIKHVK
jgi:hypothetical protein